MLEARGIGVVLGGRAVLADVDLAVTPGRIVALIGPNGAGKSTLLRTMAGERKPAQGTVTIDGADIAGWMPAALAARRAVLAQASTLTAAFTAGEIVRLGVPATMRTREAEVIVGQTLAAVDMADARHRPITELSGGEQQRVHVARALAQISAHAGSGKPRYLLLDEPTAHLDPGQQGTLLRLARTTAKEGGGVLAVLHDINAAAAIADEVVMLHRGAVIARGAPRTVLTENLLGDVYGVAFHVGAGPGGLSVMPDHGAAAALR